MSSPAPMPLENVNDFVPLPGNGTGFIHSSWARILESNGLRSLDDFFKVAGTSLSKPGLGKRYRAQIELKNGGKSAVVFLKRYNGESWRGLWRRRFEDHEASAIALREVFVAQALQKLGINTFLPLAWGWRGPWGPSQKSFVLMSRVEGESLENWVPKRFANARDTWRKKIGLIESLAQFSQRLHGSGWFHRDFYLCHIFIHEAGGGDQLALVDLARMFRPRWPRRWLIKDLAQLNFSAAPEFFSKTLRLRFAQKYFGTGRFSDEDKIVLRKIIRRTEKMRRRESSK
ncbi:MAG: lipopolysaccharide kinase InaA family protein [Verrucomicrobiota bacterium]